MAWACCWCWGRPKAAKIEAKSPAPTPPIPIVSRTKSHGKSTPTAANLSPTKGAENSYPAEEIPVSIPNMLARFVSVTKWHTPSNDIHSIGWLGFAGTPCLYLVWVRRHAISYLVWDYPIHDKCRNNTLFLEKQKNNTKSVHLKNLLNLRSCGIPKSLTVIFLHFFVIDEKKKQKKEFSLLGCKSQHRRG